MPNFFLMHNKKLYSHTDRHMHLHTMTHACVHTYIHVQCGIIACAFERLLKISFCQLGSCIYVFTHRLNINSSYPITQLQSLLNFSVQRSKQSTTYRMQLASHNRYKSISTSYRQLSYVVNKTCEATNCSYITEINFIEWH